MRFKMGEDEFKNLADWLIDRGYDWNYTGISNRLANEMIEPKFGIRVINWTFRDFVIVDEEKYVLFALGNR